jgi:cyclic pyranopterin phosphate synthase
MANKLSHTDSKGKARMVDVGHKTDQQRSASAQGFISLNQDTVKLIHDNNMKKGDVLTLAEVAGIQAAKRTADLIPLCHTLQITKVSVVATLEQNGVKVSSEVRCIGQTGVEMEALTAVSVALLTVYDMCKAVDKDMIINQVLLTNKEKHDIS